MEAKQKIVDFISIIIGSGLMAISLLVFIIPNKLLSGGVSGLAIITHHFTAIPVGPLIILYNIPILIWARKELQGRFIIYTSVAVALQSVFLLYLRKVTPYTNDIFLASVFGGAIVGMGAGLIIRHHGSSGGLDVIGIVLRKRLGITIGTVSFVANIFIIGIAAFVFGLEPAMYTLVSLFTAGRLVDVVQEGFNRKRTAMIISDQSAEIKDAIISQLKRGVTLVHGAGGYYNTEKDVLFCVVNLFELPRLKEIVIMIDQQAFMNIFETTEVQGRFKEHGLRTEK